MNCNIPKCPREADGECLIRGNAVCHIHLEKHWRSKNIDYIWDKLGLKREEKVNQLTLI